MYSIEHKELLSIIKLAANTAAVATVEAFQKHGELISRPDIIREIGRSLYRQGVENQHLHPFRNNNTVKGKVMCKTSDYLAYKQLILN